MKALTRPERTAGREGRLVAYRAGSDVAGKLIVLGVTVAAARVLPAEAFGTLALAMTTGWLLGVATDAGLPMHLAREAAREGAAVRPLVLDVMRVRGLFAAGAAIAGVLAAWVLAPPPYGLAFVAIVLAQLAGAVLDTLAHLYRGMGRTDVESAIHLGQRLALGTLAALALTGPGTLDALALALLLPPVGALSVSGGAALWLTRDVAGRRAVPLSAARLARDVLPIGLGVLLSALYFRSNLYFVDLWHGVEAAGQFNAAFRLVEAARLIPAAVLAVTFPHLVRATDPAMVARVGSALLAAGAAIGLVLLASAEPAMLLLYGEAFRDAAPALAVLAGAVPLFFLNYALTHQVIAWDGQRAFAWVAALALGANLALNAVLVPPFGLAGAAGVTVITELVVMFGALAALRRPMAGGATLVGPAGAGAGGAR